MGGQQNCPLRLADVEGKLKVYAQEKLLADLRHRLQQT